MKKDERGMFCQVCSDAACQRRKKEEMKAWQKYTKTLQN